MRTGTILVVDDEQNTRAALQRELSPHFSLLLLAENADAAEELMSQHKIDVTIMDEKMPGRTGLEFLEVIGAKYPGMQCILLTGWASHHKIKQAIKDGRICTFIRKPWEHEVLLDLVKKALDASLAQTAIDAWNLPEGGGSTR